MAITPPADNPPLGALEPANSARRGHPRTVPHAKMSSKGRTELQISLSRAKNAEEAADDIRFCVFPQQTGKNAETLIFSSKMLTHRFFRQFFFEIFRKSPNASERIQMHPNASERIRMHPNRSEQVRASRKTSENLRKPRKLFEIFPIFLRFF